MTELDKQIIELLTQGTTAQELKAATKLCNSKLIARLEHLKNMGFQITRALTEETLQFQIDSKLSASISPHTLNTRGTFSFIALSDTHLGGISDDLDAIKNLYQYAEEKHINHVFHLGDLIQGENIDEQHHYARIDNIHEQLNYALALYPKKETITTSLLLGNHDQNCLTNSGINIAYPIEHKRYLDMFIVGKTNCEIHLNNLHVILHHPNHNRENSYDKTIIQQYKNPKLILRGHTHQGQIYITKEDIIVAHVPAAITCKSTPIPQAYHICLIPDNNPTIFDSVTFLPLFMTPTVYEGPSIKYPLTKSYKNKN